MFSPGFNNDYFFFSDYVNGRDFKRWCVYQNHVTVQLATSIERVVAGLIEGLRDSSFGMIHRQVNTRRDECEAYMERYSLGDHAHRPVKQFLHYPRVIRGISEASRYLRLTKEMDRSLYDTMASWDSMSWVRHFYFNPESTLTFQPRCLAKHFTMQHCSLMFLSTTLGTIYNQSWNLGKEMEPKSPPSIIGRRKSSYVLIQ